VFFLGSAARPGFHRTFGNRSALKLDYPDSTAGLEHLVKDIIKAQKESAGSRADALLQPSFFRSREPGRTWPLGSFVAQESKSLHEKSGAGIPNSMAQFLLHAVSHGMNDDAARFDKFCDNNSGGDVFGILEVRRQPIPPYELLLIKAPTFVRLFAFAFVDGGFRFILPPKLHGNVFGTPKADSADSGTAAPVEKRPTIAGHVQAARNYHQGGAPVSANRAR